MAATRPSRYAITFGEVAILHIGGVEVGRRMRDRGFTVQELEAAAERFGDRAQLFRLSDALPAELRAGNEAATLVVRGGADALLEEKGAADALLEEQEKQVRYDKRFWDARYKKTLCKRARHNVIFGEVGQEPSEDFQMPTIKAFGELPRLAALRRALPGWLGENARDLLAEGSHYFEAASGIGFHGDSERKIVICLSLGATSTLRYHWRLPGSSAHTLPGIDIQLHHGDLYVMSEKATGFDWRLRSKVRLVHAAGSMKYIGEKRERDRSPSAKRRKPCEVA